MEDDLNWNSTSYQNERFGGDFLLIIGRVKMLNSTNLRRKEDDFQRLAEWIDTDVIAEAIKNAIEHTGVDFTFKKGKDFWLDFLEVELWDGLKRTTEI